jgi:hypothetical protein
MSIFKKISCLFLLSLATCSYASSQDDNYSQVSPRIKNICQQVFKISLPSADLASDSELKNLKNCNAVDLYYGVHQKPDYVRARQCAYVNKDYGVLTMIYANGKGVPVNWDLAIQFACRAGFAPEEIEGRVQHLLDLRAKSPENSEFDFCDDVTSGYMMGICDQRKSDIAQVQRDKKLKDLLNNWSAEERKAFEKLQQAAQHFFSIRSNNEVDLSGTARGSMVLEEQDSLQDDFLKSLQDLSAGHFPVYTTPQAAQYDDQLNQVYRQIQQNKDFSYGSVSPQGIKKTQLAWLKYRDAWIDFGKVKYPQISSESWQVWLTQKRVQMLQELNSN